MVQKSLSNSVVYLYLHPACSADLRAVGHSRVQPLPQFLAQPGPTGRPGHKLQDVVLEPLPIVERKVPLKGWNLLGGPESGQTIFERRSVGIVESVLPAFMFIMASDYCTAKKYWLFILILLEDILRGLTTLCRFPSSRTPPGGTAPSIGSHFLAVNLKLPA